MTNYTHNHDRSAEQRSIFDEFNSTADGPITLKITTLEDCRGDGCTYTTDPTVINQAFRDFSGDPSVKMEVSEDHTHKGLVLTLSDNGAHPVSTSRIHSNTIGVREVAEDGWVWYSRG